MNFLFFFFFFSSIVDHATFSSPSLSLPHDQEPKHIDTNASQTKLISAGLLAPRDGSIKEGCNQAARRFAISTRRAHLRHMMRPGRGGHSTRALDGAEAPAKAKYCFDAIADVHRLQIVPPFFTRRLLVDPRSAACGQHRRQRVLQRLACMSNGKTHTPAALRRHPCFGAGRGPTNDDVTSWPCVFEAVLVYPNSWREQSVGCFVLSPTLAAGRSSQICNL